MGVDESGVNVYPPFGRLWLFLGRICLGAYPVLALSLRQERRLLRCVGQLYATVSLVIGI